MMEKWARTDGVIISEQLRSKIFKFYSKHQLKLPFILVEDDKFLFPTSIDQIHIYKILNNKFQPQDLIFTFTPREVAEQITFFARTLYLEIKTWFGSSPCTRLHF
jgi:hypothetical protein